MSAIVKTRAQQTARELLIQTIKRELKRENVTRASEMTGYWLAGIQLSERYNQPPTELPSRKLVAPEFLTGLLSNNRV